MMHLLILILYHNKYGCSSCHPQQFAIPSQVDRGDLRRVDIFQGDGWGGF